VTIEIRELIVRAQVGAPAPAPAAPISAQLVERLRRELLAECRAMLKEQQQQRRER
jgi:Family of unknown function (DUF5908)